MEFEHDITWSKRTYAIRDISSNEECQGKHSLPLLVKITRGFYGIKEEDTVDIDQMLVFNESGEETCVLARNEDGCCLSVPVNHPHRFQRLTSSGSLRGNHANKETQTLREILEKVRLPTKVQFDETIVTSFTVADQLRNTEEFGAFTLVSTHPIEYIHANPVYEGEVHRDHVMFIPNYRDVRFVIAEGPQPCVKSFLDVKDKTTQPHSEQTLSIIGYDDIELSDDEYEPVVPGQFTKPKKLSKEVGANEPKVPEENYEEIVPKKLNTPQKANKTNVNNVPQLSMEDFDLIVAGKLTKTQGTNKTGGDNDPQGHSNMYSKPETGGSASSSKRDSAIQKRFSRDYEKVRTVNQTDPGVNLQGEERDVFNTNTAGRRHPMARSNSSVTEQARLLERSLQVLAGGRPGGGKYSRSTSGSSGSPQHDAKPKGGPPRRSSSLSNSPPAHWREPLPLPKFATVPKTSFSRPPPGGSNRCSTSSNSSAGSGAGVGGSPPAESPYLNPISMAGVGGGSRGESPPLSHRSMAGVGGSPRGESPSLSHSHTVGGSRGESPSLSHVSSSGVGGSPRGGSPCLSPTSSTRGGGSPGADEDLYMSPIGLLSRKGSMCIGTLEEVPGDLSGLSVGDVCDCLQLLHMAAHMARFQEDQVDGTLLAECSAEDLRDMGLSPLHAKKLVMFTKGWRPKV